MKKFFNSFGVLIGLILVFIGVLANRKAINGVTEKAIAILELGLDLYKLNLEANSNSEPLKP